jgi:hypothetical protein
MKKVLKGKKKIKKDKSKIPYGYYCYDENGVCPYWKRVKNRSKYENGFCDYLGYGDWDVNEKEVLTGQTKDPKTGKIIQLEKGTGHQLGLLFSTIWDQVKECNINIHKKKRRK